MQRVAVEVKDAIRFFRHDQRPLAQGILRRDAHRAGVCIAGQRLDTADREHEPPPGIDPISPQGMGGSNVEGADDLSGGPDLDLVPYTRAYYAETLPNPKLEVFPIADVAAIGREQGIPLIMDNTAAPLLCRPFDHGAAVVVYSATKYLGGHGTSIGGLIVDGGNFDWTAFPDRQPLLNTPDPSYHGAIWAEAAKPLGPIAYILRARVILLRDLGAALSPFNAFQMIQGIETVALRMERHCANAVSVAEHLAQHPAVVRVIHPSQQEGGARELADRYLTGGQGGLVGFELAGGLAAGRRFIDALQLFYHVANIGDARSLAIHPASTTHSQLNKAEQLASGVSPGYIRLSIGIEHISDILADIDQALAAAA